MRAVEPDFPAVVAQGVALQGRLAEPDVVAVGDTAVALHCGHRFSLDVDCVTPRLRDDYAGYVERLESWAGWQTNRRNPPVLILGQREDIELGLRQLRRRVPLETTLVQGLRIPTTAEMLRVKAFLLAERRATRDYLDVAALSQALGIEAALHALRALADLYPSIGPQTAATAFAEASEAVPADLPLVDLRRYRGIRPPFTDWPHIAATVQKLGRALIKWELGRVLPERPE